MQIKKRAEGREFVPLCTTDIMWRSFPVTFAHSGLSRMGVFEQDLF